MIQVALLSLGVDQEAVAVKPDEADLAPAHSAGKVQAQSFEHVAVVPFEVLDPCLFDLTEGVGLRDQDL